MNSDGDIWRENVAGKIWRDFCGENMAGVSREIVGVVGDARLSTHSFF